MPLSVTASRRGTIMSDIHPDAASRRGCEVTIQSVSKRYSTHLVLDDVSMTIRPGEFFTLLGPSGCGKTTLLRSVAGFHAINSGHILFDGVDVSTRAPGTEISVLSSRTTRCGPIKPFSITWLTDLSYGKSAGKTFKNGFALHWLRCSFAMWKNAIRLK